MSLIETLTLWDEAVSACDGGEFEEALRKLRGVPEVSAKILFNIGCVNMAMGRSQDAIEALTEAVTKDNHMAVGYFQRGIVHFSKKSFQKAVNDFECSNQRLRGRNVIDYKQLGLRFKLYACETLYNAAVSYAKLGDHTAARQLLDQAQESKVETRHGVIDDALKDKQNISGLPIMEIPAGTLFRPPKSKVANLQKKDYLGKAKVVSAVAETDKFSGFAGPKRMEELSKETPVEDQSNSNSLERKKVSLQEKLLNLGKSSDKSPVLSKKSPVPVHRKLPAAPNKPVPPPPNKPAPRLPYRAPVPAPSTEDEAKRGSPHLRDSANSIEDNSLSQVLLPLPKKSTGSSGHRAVPPVPKETNRDSSPSPSRSVHSIINGLNSNKGDSSDRVSLMRPPSPMRPPLPAKRGSGGSTPSGSPGSASPARPASPAIKKSPTPSRSSGDQSEGEAPPRPPKGNWHTGKLGRTPPSRPPPSLRDRPLPELPTEDRETVSKKPVPLVRKGLPKPANSHSSLVSADLHCQHKTTVEVPRLASLQTLLDSAAEVFTLSPDTFDLWYKRKTDDELTPIEDEEDMMNAWGEVNENAGRLVLWCYGKH